MFSSILQFWYVEVRISRSISKSPLEFEITRVDCNFLLLLKNIDYGYSLESSRRGDSNEYSQSKFWAEIWKKKVKFFIWKLSVLGGEIFNIFE